MSRCRHYKRITIGNLWRYDLPAVLRFVRKTNIKNYFLMGHSLGGITALAFSSHVNDPMLKGIVAIAAPVTFTVWQREKIVKLINIIDLLKPITWRVWSFPGNYLLTPFTAAGLKYISLIKLFGNPENIDPEEARIMLRRAVSPYTPIKMIDQLKRALIKGPLIDDYDTDYLHSLKNMKVPVLFIAGYLDNLSPPQVVKMNYKFCGSKDKTLVIASKQKGFLHNYGHIDLVVGKDSDKEILPIIQKWLENHIN